MINSLKVLIPIWNIHRTCCLQVTMLNNWKQYKTLKRKVCWIRVATSRVPLKRLSIKIWSITTVILINSSKLQFLRNNYLKRVRKIWIKVGIYRMITLIQIKTKLIRSKKKVKLRTESKVWTILSFKLRKIRIKTYLKCNSIQVSLWKTMKSRRKRSTKLLKLKGMKLRNDYDF